MTKSKQKRLEDQIFAVIFLAVVIFMAVYGMPKWQQEREAIDSYNQQLGRQMQAETYINELKAEVGDTDNTAYLNY